MTLTQVDKTFQESTNFERRSTTVINDDVMCICFMNGLGNAILWIHAMSHRAKLVTHLIMVELQKFLNRMVVDSPHMGRAVQSQDDTAGNGDGRGNGKRPRDNGGNGID
jgi:hypothetical protein